jgi:hypothetical protein
VTVTNSADLCRDHARCEHNRARNFHSPQVCLSCERKLAVHFLDGVALRDIDAPDASFALRCDECLLSRQGCPHAGRDGDICPECFDYICAAKEEAS